MSEIKPTLAREILEAWAARGIIESLEKKGGSKKAIEHIKATFWKPELLDQLDTFGRQFVTRGHIWEDVPSICAKQVAKTLPVSGRVLDLGCGYGRDGKFLVDRNYIYEGIDISQIAIFEASNFIQQSNRYSRNSRVYEADFAAVNLTSNFFDYVIAHRSLHLPEKEDLPIIIEKVHDALNSDGKIVFTVRAPEDFDADDMNRIDEYTAEYKDPMRKGHRLHFNDKLTLDPILSPYFTNLVYERIEERESCDNFKKDGTPKVTKLVKVSGDKKKGSQREQINNHGNSDQPEKLEAS